MYPGGLIEAATGVRARRSAGDNTNSSDLAVQAASIALERAGLNASDLDLIIFAAASLDVIEPATANMVQQKPGATYPMFEVNK